VAGWISLFTLHAIWPFLWIWATLYREERGWGFQSNTQAPTPATDGALAELKAELQSVSERLSALERTSRE
jgi:hypothetical protein